MNFKIQIIINRENDDKPIVEEIACFKRGRISIETLGLMLQESKELLTNLQESMITHQINEYIEQESHCSHCHSKFSKKDSKEIVFRSLFGKLKLRSPRFYSCSCSPDNKRSFSPLAELLPERTAPEFIYLQSKWASLMSYGLTADLLKEILPVHVATTSVSRHTYKVAERIEQELGNEQFSYINGCEREWDNLPYPGEPITVGIDGGYVHAREGEDRKAGWFEVIVGKSMQDNHESKRFSFVNKYDNKPKRRLFEMLKSQGLQMNQSITFLSDGGDTVRDLQLYLSPNAEHYLDWFHVTMRITVLKQMNKGSPGKKQQKDIERELDRIKWFLWHGNVFMALQTIEFLQMDLEALHYEQPSNAKIKKILKKTDEFYGYISNNRSFIPNYADRYHYGESISTAFVESTVNEVVSKRMVKKQQMRWTPKGAHLLLQVRTKTLNGELKDKFCDWFPGMMKSEVGSNFLGNHHKAKQATIH